MIFDFLLTYRNLAGGGIDNDIHRMRERRPFLHVVIAYETKTKMLGKDRCFVIKRAVFEVEHQMGDDPASFGDLKQVTSGKFFSFQCAQHEKAVKGPFRVTYTYRFGPQRA